MRFCLQNKVQNELTSSVQFVQIIYWLSSALFLSVVWRWCWKETSCSSFVVVVFCGGHFFFHALMIVCKKSGLPYLIKAIPSSTGVRHTWVVTWAWLKQQQEQCHPALLVYVMFLSLPGYGYSCCKNNSTQSSQCLCVVSVFTWVRQQRPQEQCYPISPMSVMFRCLPG